MTVAVPGRSEELNGVVWVRVVALREYPVMREKGFGQMVRIHRAYRWNLEATQQQAFTEFTLYAKILSGRIWSQPVPTPDLQGFAVSSQGNCGSLAQS